MIQHHSPEEEEAQRRMLNEFLGKAQREWEDARMSADDDGIAAFAIATDLPHQVVRIQFTKPMKWIGLNVKSARQLAEMLWQKADEIEKFTVPKHD